MANGAPPRAQGQRLTWPELPDRIRAAIEGSLGDRVVEAESMSGGYSPGLASRLVTSSGRRVFAKAVSNQLNPDSPRIHRREIEVAAHLPKEAPVPRLLWSMAELTSEEWAVLVFEEVEGHPPAQPWVPAEFDRVVDALNELAAELTPSPVPATAIGSVADWEVLRPNWRLLAESDTVHPDPWVRRNLDRLVEAERAIPHATGGDTLLHLDLRGDNMLMARDGVVIVDWPYARVGAAWIDPAFFAPSVAMEGGPEPEALVERIDVLRSADPDALTAGIIGAAGFLTERGAREPVPGLPGLRAFQEAQGVVARRWVAERTGWK
jgi:aminoglycoside phosphotransferase (APT) family kinase protein